MYLVHVQLLADHEATLPADTPAALMRCARPNEHVEHVALHLTNSQTVVLGVFLRASSLAEGERVAADVCRRALDTQPSLQGFTMVSAAAGMPAAYYDRLLQDRPGEQP